MAPQLGIDIGGTKMLVAVVAADGVTLHRWPTGKTATAAQLEVILREFITQLPERPSSIGVAIPGLVGEAGEVVACDVIPGLAGWRPADAFAGYAPTRAANDAVAALAHETHALTGATAAVVMVGTGIGAAFLVGGRLLRGARGWAGELGSAPVAVGDRATTLDALASGAALVASLGDDAAAITRRAEQGDPAVVAALARAGAALGIGLAIVINLINPELVVLGGGTLRYPGYYEAALRAAQSAALPEHWGACTIRRSADDDRLVALGAARIAAARDGEWT